MLNLKKSIFLFTTTSIYSFHSFSSFHSISSFHSFPPFSFSVFLLSVDFLLSVGMPSISNLPTEIIVQILIYLLSIYKIDLHELRHDRFGRYAIRIAYIKTYYKNLHYVNRQFYDIMSNEWRITATVMNSLGFKGMCEIKRMNKRYNKHPIVGSKDISEIPFSRVLKLRLIDWFRTMTLHDPYGHWRNIQLHHTKYKQIRSPEWKLICNRRV